jgi:hypothetical protein
MGPYGRQIVNWNIINRWHRKPRDHCTGLGSSCLKKLHDSLKFIHHPWWIGMLISLLHYITEWMLNVSFEEYKNETETGNTNHWQQYVVICCYNIIIWSIIKYYNMIITFLTLFIVIIYGGGCPKNNNHVYVRNYFIQEV